jgi:hypothetical protein
MSSAIPITALEVPLYWHHARLAPPAVERLTRVVVVGAHRGPRKSDLAGHGFFLRRRVAVASLESSASRLR